MGPETRYTLLQAVALVAVCALVGVSFAWGRVSAGHPKPEVYVVHESELTTTTTVAVAEPARGDSPRPDEQGRRLMRKDGARGTEGPRRERGCREAAVGRGGRWPDRPLVGLCWLREAPRRARPWPALPPRLNVVNGGRVPLSGRSSD